MGTTRAGVRPQVIKRNYKTDKVDFQSFITTALLGLGGHRLAIKIPKSSSSRARVDVAAQILPLVKK